METISIRKAIPTDLQFVYQLERAYIIEHESDQLERWDAAQEHIEQGLLDHLNGMYVSEIDGRIIGHGHWAIKEHTPCIYSIYVHKDHRRQGIASMLMTQMEEDVREHGQITLTLSTLISNPAQHLFGVLKYKEIKQENGWIYYSKSLR